MLDCNRETLKQIGSEFSVTRMTKSLLPRALTKDRACMSNKLKTPVVSIATGTKMWELMISRSENLSSSALLCNSTSHIVVLKLMYKIVLSRAYRECAYLAHCKLIMRGSNISLITHNTMSVSTCLYITDYIYHIALYYIGTILMIDQHKKTDLITKKNVFELVLTITCF